MEKARRRGKVLVDWSQNHRAKTTIAPYSLRGGPEPTVSTPVGWDEVEHVADSGDASALSFLPDDVLARVEDEGDLLAPLHTDPRRLR
jgi:bifunctional non-homologous end joining protein LigD